MEMLEGVVNELPDLSKPRLPDVKPADLSSKACKSDEFRMYAFKIKRCSRTRAHDWTQCPYAHRGEKARRRDPCKFNYAGIACPDFRRPGGCPRGDACEFAHGVFEFWLHPARYRTRACKAGRCCQRKVCFFAHTPEQLRGGATKYACNTLRSQAVEEAARSHPAPVGLVAGWEDCCLEEGMRALKVGDEMDCPDIDWVLDLVG